MDIARCEAASRLGDEESANAFVRARPHCRNIGDAAVRDPHLGTVENPVRAVAHRMSAHAGGIRAEVRLGEAEASNRFTGGKNGQPLLLLLD